MSRIQSTAAWTLFFLISALAFADNHAELRADLVKDLDSAEKARQNRPELHRSFVKKWNEAGMLDAVVEEYAARAFGGAATAPLLYGYGYALAVRNKPGDLDNAVAALMESIKLEPNFQLAYFTLGGTYLKYAQQTEKVDKDWLKQALKSYQECLRIDETYAPAHYGIAETMRVQKEYEAALEHYETAMQLSGQDWALPHYGKALAYEALGDIGRAVSAARLALVIDEKHTRAMYLLGQLRAGQGFPAEAVELYNKAEALTGKVPAEELLRLARVFVKTENDADAETFYQRAVEAAPEHAQTRMELGELLWRKGDPTAAAVEYHAAVELNPKLKGVHTQQARTLYEETDPPDEAAAREALDKALAVNELMTPKEAAPHLLYAQIETESGNADEAIRHYETAAVIEPDSLEVYFPLGDLHYAAGAMDLAKQAYVKAAELDPGKAGQYAEYAEGVHAQNRLEEAVAAWDKHLMILPDDAEARYMLARSYEETDQTPKALAHYETLRETAPDTEDALYRLSKIYIAQERSEEALTVMEELVVLRPDDPAAHYMLGDTLYTMEKHSRALLVFMRVVELDETHALAHEKIGLLLEPTDPDAAEVSYLRVVELDPEYPGPYFRLATISLVVRNDEETGILRLEEGLERDPKRPDEQHTLAALYDKRGELTEAMPHYAAAVELKPEQDAWQYAYARCAHRAADAAEKPEEKEEPIAAADAAYTAAIETEPDADRHYWRGRLRLQYRQTGGELHLMNDIALDFRAVLKLEPKRLEARYWLGKTMVEMDQLELARQMFQQLLKMDAKYPEANAELGRIEEREVETTAAQKKRAEKRNKAMEYYRLEVKVNPKSYTAHLRLGFLYVEHVADPSLGAEHLGKAVELNPTDPEVFFHYARALYAISQLRKSARAFEMAIKLNPKHIAANHNLATVYEYLEEPKLAAARLRHLLTLEGVPGEWRVQAQRDIKRLEAMSGQ